MRHGTLIKVDLLNSDWWLNQGFVGTWNGDKIRTFQVFEKKRHGARFEEYGGCGKKVTLPDFKNNCFTSSNVSDRALSEVDVLALILTQGVVYDNNFELFKYNI